VIEAVISLGANLGDARGTIRGAIQALAQTAGICLKAVSGLYGTAPVGGVEQPDFVNAIAIVETALDPQELLGVLQSIELRWHRTRQVRWGPRTLDLDMVTYGALVSDDPALTLPHPRAHERAFVLVPWLEIDPRAQLPGWGAVAHLMDELSHEGVTMLPNP